MTQKNRTVDSESKSASHGSSPQETEFKKTFISHFTQLKDGSCNKSTLHGL